MAVMNDTQLSKDFDGLCLAKGYLYLLFRPQLFTVLLSPLFCQYILHRKQLEYKISIHHLFVYFWQPRVHSELHGQFQGHEILMTSRNYKMSYINIEERKMIEDSMAIYNENM